MDSDIFPGSSVPRSGPVFFMLLPKNLRVSRRALDPSRYRVVHIRREGHSEAAHADRVAVAKILAHAATKVRSSPRPQPTPVRRLHGFGGILVAVRVLRTLGGRSSPWRAWFQAEGRMVPARGRNGSAMRIVPSARDGRIFVAVSSIYIVVGGLKWLYSYSAVESLYPWALGIQVLACVVRAESVEGEECMVAEPNVERTPGQ